jgi:gamma-glutamyltranspeptidase / glutathione hydrolase
MTRSTAAAAALALLAATGSAQPARTAKPVLHGKHWMAITGKPLGATAGAMMFNKGGNAVDAACAMIAATSTMWDTLSWGGETQALIFDPRTGKVVAINALGVAPTGATAEFFKGKGMKAPPEHGPLAAVTPGTPGGIIVMLAEYGTLSLADVLAPSIQMAEEGYPIEAQAVRAIGREKRRLEQWPYSGAVMLPRGGQPPEAGELFKQPDLAATLRKLVDAEKAARAKGLDRKAALYAAYDRFYKGDVAQEFVRGAREQGALVTIEDLAAWKVHVEEPVKTRYKDIDVYKLDTWQQGPVMLQALNLLETLDLKAMGYNSARYIHALYQAMNLAFADRDFYYGDPYFPPQEPIAGLLSKDYARERAKLIRWDRNDPDVKPGDPYPFQGGINPFLGLLEKWKAPRLEPGGAPTAGPNVAAESLDERFYAGTTSVQAADEKGWVVSVTPSGGWIPAVIAGRTGMGMSQRMQSFVLEEAEGPYNVVAPGKRPRATLTPSLALKDGKPLLSFAVQGGDSQDQNLLQFFLNVVEFGMNVQEAAEAPNMNTFQLRASLGEPHVSRPGRLLLNESMPSWVRAELSKMGYELTFQPLTSGPINAIQFDRAHGTMWGGSSNHGEDYGIAW